MQSAVIGFICFGGGYALCKLLGPKIDVEAGVIIHNGVAYFKSELARVAAKL